MDRLYSNIKKVLTERFRVNLQLVQFYAKRSSSLSEQFSTQNYGALQRIWKFKILGHKIHLQKMQKQVLELFEEIR